MSTWSLAVVASVVVAYALVSRRLDRTPVTAGIFFLSAGLLFGSKGLDWLDLGARSETVRVLAEATLTLVLFADASRIDLGALRREYVVPARLLGIGLPLTIVAGCALAAGILGSLSFGEALILAIILAPTDAALGQAVVTDLRLPSRIRQGLNIESGLNDGICVPLLFIALAISEAEAQTTSTHGALKLVAESIGYGLLSGVVCGLFGAVLLRLARSHDLVEGSWLQVIPVGDGGALVRSRRPARRQRIHRRVRRRADLRRPSRRREHTTRPARGARRARERGHVHRLRRRIRRAGPRPT